MSSKISTSTVQDPPAAQGAGRSRLAVNYALLSAGEFIAKIFGLLAFAYLARVLGPQHYGYLEFTIALVFAFTLVVDCGLSAYTAREIAKDRSAASRFAVHLVAVRVLLAIGAFLILALFAGVSSQPPAVKRLIILYALTLFGLPGLLQGVFQGLDRMHYVALASILRWTIFAGGVLLFVRGPEQLATVAVVEGAAVATLVVYYLWRVSRSVGSLWQPIDRSFGLSMLRQALPIGASEMVWAVRVYFATVMLGLLVGGSEVGWFASAQRIVVSLHTFVWLYFFNLLASLSRCTQGLPQDLQRLMARSMQVAGWAAVFVGIVGAALARPLITFLYGEQYATAGAIFQVLVWILPLTLLHGHYRYALIAYGQQRLEFVATAGAAALNIVLTLVLVPAYGPIGAAWALVASEVLIWGLAYYLTRRTVAHLPLWPHLRRPLFTGAILAGALYLLRSGSVWVMGGVAIGIYGLGLSLLQPSLLLDARSLLLRSRS
jgi:O-antigen/teichoic acid export membrane protein